VKEEEAKSLEGKGQRERSVNYSDPTGLFTTEGSDTQETRTEVAKEQAEKTAQQAESKRDSSARSQSPQPKTPEAPKTFVPDLRLRQNYGYTPFDASFRLTPLNREVNETVQDAVEEPKSALEQNRSIDLRNSKYRAAADENLGQPYESGKNDCDIWVEKRTQNAGKDVSSAWGSAVDNSVADHLKTIGADAIDKPKKGPNVFFQGEDHTGLLLVNSNGSADVYHQGWNPASRKWDSETKHYSSVSAFEGAWSGTKKYWPQ
jgi:hypothetical protein